MYKENTVALQALQVVVLWTQPLVNCLHRYDFKTRIYIYPFSLRSNPSAPEAFYNNNNNKIIIILIKKYYQQQPAPAQ